MRIYLYSDLTIGDLGIGFRMTTFRDLRSFDLAQDRFATKRQAILGKGGLTTGVYFLITDYTDYAGNFVVENERSLGRIGDTD